MSRRRLGLEQALEYQYTADLLPLRVVGSNGRYYSGVLGGLPKDFEKIVRRTQVKWSCKLNYCSAAL